MTARASVIRLLRALTIAPPADLTTTISAVLGNVVTLAIPAGTIDAWEGGLLTVNNGTAKRERVPITSNVGNTIVLSSRFEPGATPAVGDSVTLSGGPLATAVIEAFEPDSVVAERNIGKKNFITLSMPGQKILRTTLGRGVASRGMINTSREFTFNVIAETPDVISGTAEQVYEAKMLLPTFVEQILARVVWFRSQAAAGLSGKGDIEVVMGMWQRDGGPTTNIAGINFMVVYDK